MVTTTAPRKRQRTIEDDPECIGAMVLRVVANFGPIERPEEHDEAPLAPYPTMARAGSIAKILVMRERVEQGYRPCHPDDNPLVELQVIKRFLPE